MELKGKKVISVLRCSTDEQAAKSIPQQHEANEQYAAQEKMIIVDEVPLPGFSASVGEQMQSMHDLIQRKLSGEDFDGLLAQNWGRFARDQDDGNRLYAECREAGLFLVPRKEGLLAGRQSWITRGLAGYEEEGYAVSLSSNTNRGAMAAIVGGRIPHARRPPFGVDRSIMRKEVSGKEKPLYIIRRLRDGTRVRLSPNPPYAEEARFGPEKKHPYALCEDDRIEFIPGAEDDKRIVMDIFQRYYRDGWGLYKIAKELNNKNVPSPFGNLWHMSAIKSILTNSSYFGIGVTCRFGAGKHSFRAAGGPKEFEEPRAKGYNPDGSGTLRKRPPQLKRPSNEWHFVKHKQLLNFLPKEIKREAKKAFHKKYKEARAGAPRRKRMMRRYGSEFILSGLMTAQPGNCPMVGAPTCQKLADTKFKYRYYNTPRAQNTPKDGVIAARVRADLLENALLAEVEKIFAHPEELGIEDRIRQFIREERAATATTRSVIDTLLSQKRDIEARYRVLMNDLGEHGRELFKADVARLEAQVDQITHQIGSCKGQETRNPEDADAIVKSVMNQLRAIGATIKQEPLPAVKKLIEVFFTKLIFHATTREVEAEMRVPSWALTKEPVLVNAVRLIGAPSTFTALPAM